MSINSIRNFSTIWTTFHYIPSLSKGSSPFCLGSISLAVKYCSYNQVWLHFFYPLSIMESSVYWWFVFVLALWNQSIFNFDDEIRCLLLILESLIIEDSVQINGLVAIINLANFPTTTALHLFRPTTMRKLFESLQVIFLSFIKLIDFFFIEMISDGICFRTLFLVGVKRSILFMSRRYCKPR